MTLRWLCKTKTDTTDSAIGEFRGVLPEFRVKRKTGNPWMEKPESPARQNSRVRWGVIQIGGAMPKFIFFQGILAAFLTTLSIAGLAAGGEPKRVQAFVDLPINEPPINYDSAESQDPVARLNRRIENEGLKLEFSERFGYLPAVLKELEIPASSQILRFLSSGLERFVITPQRPRAFYFNDDTLVGWHADSAVVEIVAQDSQKGTLFYTLANHRNAPPRFERRSVCLSCHNNSGWLGNGIAAPGHLVRSSLSNDESRGYPLSNLETHTLPVELRWRWWYVTGVAERQKHLGNFKLRKHNNDWVVDEPPRQFADIREEFDVGRYLTDTSDAVAHLVFDHQMHAHNLLSRLSYEHHLHVRSNIAAMVVRYLLLVDEAPLDHPTNGKSAFADWYQAHRKKDAAGRSLYDLDLATRLFRHRISPLVQSQMVQNLPAELKQSLFRRLNNVLTGNEELKGYTISEADRQATLAVVRATVANWPKE
jgi:hypothetical protein